MPHAVVSSHPSLQDFLDHSPIGSALRQAASAGGVIVVPPGEGSNRVQSHRDMQGYLKGRSLREAVTATAPPSPSPAPAVERPSSPGHAGRRRPG